MEIKYLSQFKTLVYLRSSSAWWTSDAFCRWIEWWTKRQRGPQTGERHSSDAFDHLMMKWIWFVCFCVCAAHWEKKRQMKMQIWFWKEENLRLFPGLSPWSSLFKHYSGSFLWNFILPYIVFSSLLIVSLFHISFPLQFLFFLNRKREDRKVKQASRRTQRQSDEDEKTDPANELTRCSWSDESDQVCRTWWRWRKQVLQIKLQNLLDYNCS